MISVELEADLLCIEWIFFRGTKLLLHKLSKMYLISYCCLLLVFLSFLDGLHLASVQK